MLGGAYCLPENYSRTDAPNEHDHDHEKPLEVSLKINHLDVLEVDDIRFTIKLQMYLGIQWDEPRIINVNEASEDDVRSKKVNLDLKQLELLWVPDLDIYNLSKVEKFEVIKNSAGKHYNYIRPRKGRF